MKKRRPRRRNHQKSSETLERRLPGRSRSTTSHLLFRSWCPHCVAGKAQDRPHKKRENQGEKQIPENVFDYCFLGGKDDAETLAAQVARGRRTQMLFAHVVPRKGMVHEHGAAAMVSDIERLGYKDVILKCDGERAMKSVQEEVKRRRMDPTILENSVPWRLSQQRSSRESSQSIGRACASTSSRPAREVRIGDTVKPPCDDVACAARRGSHLEVPS